MSQLSGTSFANLYGSSGTTFPDNTTQEISEADARQFGQDIKDSFWNKTDHPVIYIKGTDAQTVGNVGTGEDSLWAHVFAANYLANNGDSLRISLFGTHASNGNAKTLKVYIGATLISSIADTTSGGSWSFDIEIIRTGASSQVCNVRVMKTGATTVLNTFTVTAIDLTAAVTVSLTGEATADNDLVKRCAKIRFEPAGSYQS